MKRLMLVKGLSYSTRTISARKGVPFEVEENVAVALLKTGRFLELPVLSGMDEKDVTAEPEGDTKAEVEGAGQPRSFADMTKPELETFAAANGIDLRGCKSKADVLAKVEAFAEGAPEAELDFGSPTMEGLQE